MLPMIAMGGGTKRKFCPLSYKPLVTGFVRISKISTRTVCDVNKAILDETEINRTYSAYEE